MRKAVFLILLAALVGCASETPGPSAPTNPCYDGRTECDGECVDLMRNPNHCGQCGMKCEEGVCVEGKCQFECPRGTTECDGECVDLKNTDEHCGACGKACGPGETCVDSTCICAEGFRNCDGACVDINSDAAHCGGCGRACGENEVCEKRTCVCAPGTFECLGECIAPTDEHCGECGRKCPPAHVCQDGECVLSCPEGMLGCDGRCIDPMNDKRYCGDCETSCVEGQSCVEGACVCDDGKEFCDGACVDTNTDPNHCGGCGTTCPADRFCFAGQCQCQGLLKDCDGVCVDTTRDLQNCGACGNVCLGGPNAEPPQCKASACVLTCHDLYGDCDGDPSTGCESFLAADVENCGACGRNCLNYANVASAICADMSCVLTCATNFGDCDRNPETGCETDLTQLESCGACGNDCTLAVNLESVACVDSGSGYACDYGNCLDGWADCDMDMTNGCETSIRTKTNCGTCGNACDVVCGSDGCAMPVDLVVGRDHNVCVLLDNGEVWCWGKNDLGQLGSPTGNRLSPQPIGVALTNVVQLAAGQHFCAVIDGGSVACWGENSWGQVGDGTTNYQPTPTVVSGIGDVQYVGVGASHTCALTDAGSVFCWGRNDLRQLGQDATVTHSTTPVQVPGLPPVVQLSVGWNGACGVLADGTMRCWGENDSGQLGTGATSPAEGPVEPPIVEVAAVSLGHKHACALFLDDTVKCWGNNQFGQMGFPQGASPTELVPVAVASAEGAVAVQAGYRHNCAVMPSRELVCWGANTYGEIGSGFVSAGSPPVAISVPLVEKVSLGTNSSCILAVTGEVHCWGRNENGQVGIGTTSPNRPNPSEAQFP